MYRADCTTRSMDVRRRCHAPALPARAVRPGRRRAACGGWLPVTAVGCVVLCAWLAPGARASSGGEKTNPSLWPIETGGVSAVVTSEPRAVPAPLSLTLPLDPAPFAREVRLGPVDVEALLQEDLDNPDPYGRLRIGIIRTVEISAPDGQWHALPDGGHLWTLAVVSEEAVGVRLHVSDGALPVGGELRFISAADTSRVEGPFTNTGPLGTGTFWGTTFWGDGVYVEYRTPPAMAAPPGSVPFAIDKLQHLYRDPGSALPDPPRGSAPPLDVENGSGNQACDTR